MTFQRKAAECPEVQLLCPQHHRLKHRWSVFLVQRNLLATRSIVSDVTLSQLVLLLSDIAVLVCPYAVSFPLIWKPLSASSFSSGRLVHLQRLGQKEHAWLTTSFSPSVYFLTVHFLLHSRHDLNSWRMHSSSTMNSEELNGSEKIQKLIMWIGEVGSYFNLFCKLSINIMHVIITS